VKRRNRLKGTGAADVESPTGSRIENPESVTTADSEAQYASSNSGRRVALIYFFISMLFVCLLVPPIVFSATVAANNESSQLLDEPRYDFADHKDESNKIYFDINAISHSGTQRVDNRAIDLSKINTSSSEKHRFIIVFKNFSSRDPGVISQTSARVVGGRNIDIAPVIFAVGFDSDKYKIKEDPNVTSVVRDKSFRISPRPTNILSESNDTASIAASGHSDQSIPWGVRRINGRLASASVPTQAQADVNIAVLDTGIDYTHPDIDDNVVWGANFVDGVEEYGIHTADDNNGHGTMVAGLVAAEDNERGIVGVAPHSQIYSVKVLNKNNYGFYSWWIRGIDAAVKGPDKQLGTDDDADIVSMSLGGDTSTAGLRNAIKSTSEHAIIVTAAMNSGDGDPTTNEVYYPAKYPETIAVSATNRNNQTTTFSSEGSEVEVAAPGNRIATLAKDGGTNTFTGTSASTPLVSGTLALMMAKNQSVSSNQHEDILRETAVDIESSGVDNKAGHGLVQADTAIQRLDTGKFDVEIDSTNAPIAAGETLEVTANIKNTGSRSATKDIRLYVTDVKQNSTRLTLSGGESENVTFLASIKSDDSGNLTVEVSSPDDSATQSIIFNQQSVNITNPTLEPSTIDTGVQSSHTLTFRAEEVSADGEADTVMITLPDSVTVESVGAPQTKDAPYNVKVTNDRNPIRVEVNPDEQAETVNFSVEVPMELSSDGE